jgi:hypothetical protein
MTPPSIIDITDKIEVISALCSNFKIGKTGQEKEERASQQIDYEYFDVLETSQNQERIESLESFMINRFGNNPKCDNEIGGSAGKMKKSDVYILYIVFNK